MEVAELLTVKQGTYPDYESGKIRIPVDMLMKLADFYHVNLDRLTGRTDWLRR